MLECAKCIQLKICNCYLLIRCRLSVVIPSSPLSVSVIVSVVFMFIIVMLSPSLSGQFIESPLQCHLCNFIQNVFVPVNLSDEVLSDPNNCLFL